MPLLHPVTLLLIGQFTFRRTPTRGTHSYLHEMQASNGRRRYQWSP
jgi:hypothetical protein